MPSILEYLGYIFFFGGFLVGPAFEFMDYHRFSNMEIFHIDNNSNRDIKNLQLQQVKLANRHYNETKDNSLREKNHNTDESVKYYVPNGFIPAMSKLGFGIFWILCFVTFGNKYPIDWTLSEEFKERSFFDK